MCPDADSGDAPQFFDFEDDDSRRNWPNRFFEEIRIEDPAFVRPPQGEAPAVVALDE